MSTDLASHVPSVRSCTRLSANLASLEVTGKRVCCWRKVANLASLGVTGKRVCCCRKVANLASLESGSVAAGKKWLIWRHWESLENGSVAAGKWLIWRHWKSLESGSVVAGKWLLWRHWKAGLLLPESGYSGVTGKRVCCCRKVNNLTSLEVTGKRVCLCRKVATPVSLESGSVAAGKKWLIWRHWKSLVSGSVVAGKCSLAELQSHVWLGSVCGAMYLF